MPEPKFVVAVGACACSGGIFEGNYNVVGGADKVVPVTAYIPGCPPRPEAIIDGIVKLLNTLNQSKSASKDTKKVPTESACDSVEVMTTEEKLVAKE
jgi:NADH:ubiquinone oxidoreductase subunit B-like Fe-S oxidoreductase